MVKAQIKNGIVVNIIVVDPENVPTWCVNWPTVTGAGIGWSWDGINFNPPASLEVIVDPIVTDLEVTVEPEVGV